MKIFYKSKLENLKAKNLLLSNSLDIDYLDTLQKKSKSWNSK